MSTAELRVAAANGDAKAAETLVNRLLYHQARFLKRASKKRRMGQGRVIPYRGQDAFFRCARAF